MMHCSPVRLTDGDHSRQEAVEQLLIRRCRVCVLSCCVAGHQRDGPHGAARLAERHDLRHRHLQVL